MEWLVCEKFEGTALNLSLQSTKINANRVVTECHCDLAVFLKKKYSHKKELYSNHKLQQNMSKVKLTVQGEFASYCGKHSKYLESCEVLLQLWMLTQRKPWQ